jgi:hypothetical protein
MKIMRIRTFIALFFLGLGFTNHLKSWEVRSDTTLYAGFWGGLSYARIIGNDGNNKPLFAFNNGILVYYRPKWEFGFRTGINYIQKGFVHELEYFTTSGRSAGFYDTNYRFDYLNLPFNFNYNLSKGKYNVYMSIGIDLDFLMAHKIYSNSVPENFDNDIIIKTVYSGTDIYKKISFGFNYSFGMEYNLKKNFIIFSDIKFMHGTTDNYKAQNHIYFMKHRPTLINIGIRIGIPIKYTI